MSSPSAQTGRLGSRACRLTTPEQVGQRGGAVSADNRRHIAAPRIKGLKRQSERSCIPSELGASRSLKRTSELTLKVKGSFLARNGWVMETRLAGWQLRRAEAGRSAVTRRTVSVMKKLANPSSR